MKRFLIPLLAILALPTAVKGEVTYLECNLDGSFTNFEVLLNEEEREATFNHDNGNPLKGTASFTKDRILFSNKGMSFIKDRTNGNIFVRFTVGSSVKSKLGKCKKIEKAKTF